MWLEIGGSVTKKRGSKVKGGHEKRIMVLRKKFVTEGYRFGIRIWGLLGKIG